MARATGSHGPNGRDHRQVLPPRVLAAWRFDFGRSAAAADIGVIVPIVIAFSVAHCAATVSRIDWRRALWLSSPLLVTVLWFEALSSHTQWHLTVSSRSAALAIAIALSAAVLSMQQRPSPRDLGLHVDLVTAKLRGRRPN